MSDFDIGYFIGAAFMGAACAITAPESVPAVTGFVIGMVILFGGKWLWKNA